MKQYGWRVAGLLQCALIGLLVLEVEGADSGYVRHPYEKAERREQRPGQPDSKQPSQEARAGNQTQSKGAYNNTGGQAYSSAEFCLGVKEYMTGPQYGADFELLERCANEQDSSEVCQKDGEFHVMLNTLTWTLMQTDRLCNESYPELEQAKSRYGRIIYAITYGSHTLSQNLTIFDPKLMPYIETQIRNIQTTIIRSWNQSTQAAYDSMSGLLSPVYSYLKVAALIIFAVFCLGAIVGFAYCIYKLS